MHTNQGWGGLGGVNGNHPNQPKVPTVVHRIQVCGTLGWGGPDHNTHQFAWDIELGMRLTRQLQSSLHAQADVGYGLNRTLYHLARARVRPGVTQVSFLGGIPS